MLPGNSLSLAIQEVANPQQKFPLREYSSHLWNL